LARSGGDGQRERILDLVAGGPGETWRGFERVDRPPQQFVNEFAARPCVEAEWLGVLLSGHPAEGVAPDEAERVAQHPP
jgi:hypothetical protein